jgi:hypothetical protein
MVSVPKRDAAGKTDDERAKSYVKSFDAPELARMLVELENAHSKLLKLRTKGKT